MDESEVLLTSEQFWGMMGFATIAVIMSWGGIMAASEKLTEAEPWSETEMFFNEKEENKSEFIIQELKANAL